MSERPIRRDELFSMEGKVAFVTGGASGLGRRMCASLAANGAAVAVADVNAAGASAVADALARDGRETMAVHLDVTDAQSVARAVEQVVARFGRIDVGVNAAGVAGGRPGDQSLPSIWRHIIDVDLSGVYYCCLSYSDVMRRQGSGSIVNIASMSATIVNNFPHPPVDESRILSLAAYCAAKAGVRQLTRVLAAQWAPAGIRVNCISPGYMATEMTKDIFEMPEVVRHVESCTPLHRVGRPEDLDGALLYLASDASGFTTGAELLIDGGYTAW